jgi:hypothetical protein
MYFITLTIKTAMKRKFCLIALVLFVFVFPPFAQVCTGQYSILAGMPFCKFTGEGVENTSYRIGFIASYQKYFPLNFSEKSILFPAAGIFIIGTNQKYQGTTYKAKISGIDLGLFYKQKLLEDISTPYALGGLNLRAMMKDEPALAIKTGNITKVEALYHRVLLPELVIGAGYTIPLGYGELSFEIRDNIGLRAINDDRTIRSNTIALCLVVTVD